MKTRLATALGGHTIAFSSFDNSLPNFFGVCLFILIFGSLAMLIVAHYKPKKQLEEQSIDPELENDFIEWAIFLQEKRSGPRRETFVRSLKYNPNIVRDKYIAHFIKKDWPKDFADSRDDGATIYIPDSAVNLLAGKILSAYQLHFANEIDALEHQALRKTLKRGEEVNCEPAQ